MHYDIHGRTDPQAGTVLLSSGLGGAGSYWAPQIEALGRDFRLVTYDHRGTGRSSGTVPENGSIADMANDVREIASELDLASFHFVGHALGGIIGLELALTSPGMIDRLVVVNGWSKADSHTGRCFDVRIELLKHAGAAAYVKAQPIFLYPAVWLSENAARLAADEKHALEHFPGEAAVLSRIRALRAFDLDGELARITAPTLVMATKDDILVPYTRSLRLAEGLANARLDLFDFGGHAVNITEADRFNASVLAFLSE